MLLFGMLIQLHHDIERSLGLAIGVITVDADGPVSIRRDRHVDIVGQVAFEAVAAVLIGKGTREEPGCPNPSSNSQS